MHAGTKQLKAASLLLLATVFWGSSFIIMQALVVEQRRLVPGASTWFLASMSIVFRFGLAALLFTLWDARTLLRSTRSEVYQGTGLGVIGGFGLLLQMDGVNYTKASTAAFLTQCYCIFIPLIVAIRSRRWPSRNVRISTVLVFTGVLILSGMVEESARAQVAGGPGGFRLGRGELETLLASILFTAQILWLERPIFARNNPHNFSIIMFAVTAAIFLPFALLHGSARDIPRLYASTTALGLNLVLALLCTVVAYGIMNYWQRHISSTMAGLIYCAEPVCTSIFALFLPGWISVVSGMTYHNEFMTLEQFIGGSLITAANIVILFQAARGRRE